MRKIVATGFALLILTPSFALAMGCGADHYIKEEVAQISCAEGTILDTETNLCVDAVG